MCVSSSGMFRVEFLWCWCPNFSRWHFQCLGNSVCSKQYSRSQEIWWCPTIQKKTPFFCSSLAGTMVNSAIWRMASYSLPLQSCSSSDPTSLRARWRAWVMVIWLWCHLKWIEMGYRAEVVIYTSLVFRSLNCLVHLKSGFVGSPLFGMMGWSPMFDSIHGWSPEIKHVVPFELRHVVLIQHNVSGPQLISEYVTKMTWPYFTGWWLG